jgi:hypothetical protein
MDLDVIRADPDWCAAFGCGGAGVINGGVEGYTGSLDAFTLEDVAEVIASDDGENDVRDWLAVFRLHDGRFAFISAGCDYTGWD